MNRVFNNTLGLHGLELEESSSSLASPKWEELVLYELRYQQQVPITSNTIFSEAHMILEVMITNNFITVRNIRMIPVEIRNQSKFRTIFLGRLYNIYMVRLHVY